MMKYTLLMHQQDFEQVLEDLQKLGAVHLTSGLCEISDKEQEMYNRLKICNEAINKLQQLKINNFTDEHHCADEVLDDYIKTAREYEKVESQITKREREYNDYYPWGEFDPVLLKKLSENGIFLQYFVVDSNNFDKTWDDFDLYIIKQTSSKTYFVVVNTGKSIDIAATEMKPPTASLSSFAIKIGQLVARRKELNQKFAGMHIPTLINERIRLINELAYDRAALCIEKQCDEQIRIIEGYVPEDNVKSLEEILNTTDVYYFSEKPDDVSATPVLLKNKGFAKLFEPISNIFTLPIYSELDLTPFLAPFFMLFVGFCTGDAGYGLLILLSGFFIKRKLKPDFRPIVSLAQLFGVAAIVFGALTGTFFGIPLTEVGFLMPIKKYFLDNNNMMTLALGLGGFQILFGMILSAANIVRQQGWKYAIGKIGWILLLLTAVIGFGLPYIGVTIALPVLYGLYGIMVISIIAIFFFNSPGKNPFLQFGVGVWDSYNMATGLLGDLLSYVRLFALGLTGGVLGMVFNALAFDMSPDIPVVGTIVTILILLVGHTLNLVLTLLGAVVHPMRLTFVEFYKNAGFTGGGIAYNPFSRVKN